jgi:dihydroflavonol-4-reductase
LKVAVTGGSGVVGSAVIRHLVAAGHEVRALARSARSSAKLSDQGAAVIHGDVLDGDSVARLVKGAERVFHVAGVNELCPRNPSEMWRVNVDAAMGVVEESARADVTRLIHTSSAVTLGAERGMIGSETSKHRGHFLSEYERSKTVAERLVLDFGRSIQVVSVNPSSVQGPGRSTGTGALLLAVARGNLPLLVDADISLVDIDDCARGHLLAADHGNPGERYVLSGASLTVRDAIRMLRRHMPTTRSPWFISPSVLRAVGPLTDLAFRAVGKQSPLCAESARVLLHGHRYDGSRATRDLGLDYTQVEKTFARTVEWFLAAGLIRSGSPN